MRRVLAVLFAYGPIAAYPIMVAAGMGSGSVYVALAALEDGGLVRREFGPGTVERPLWSLTDAGRAEVATLARLGAHRVVTP